jgi:hypothetical protein
MGFVIIKMLDDSGDLAKDYLFVIATAGVIAAISYGVYIGDKYTCEKKAVAQGLEYKFGIWEGCLVKERDGNYIDYDKYRVLK